MSINNIYAVIGANYGDEGKGWLAYNLAKNITETSNEGTIITIMTNGGPQRGHTVVLPNGCFHVFHCFGSASMLNLFNGIDKAKKDKFNIITYYPKNFIFNPVAIMNELGIIIKEMVNAGIKPYKNMIKLRVHPRCLVTIPDDIMNNQITEKERQIKGKQHGSCGLGIWETIYRNSFNDAFEKYTTQDWYYDMSRDNKDKGFLKLKNNIRFHKNYDSELRNQHWKDFELASKDLLICPYINFEIFDYSHLATFLDVPQNASFIFENGQGLGIDQFYESKTFHTTPSSTGFEEIGILLSWIRYHNNYETELPEIKVCYCSRPYITKHGGEEPRENFLEDENALRKIKKYERTNPDNPFQGKIRYYQLETNPFYERTVRDIAIQKEYFKGLKTKIYIFFNFINSTDYKIFMDFDCLNIFYGSATFSNYYYTQTYEEGIYELSKTRRFGKITTRFGENESQTLQRQ